uniref:hypothetical protein n=1 Tax=Rhodococcus oryzae TaxID=2571143 RepID=UPI00145CBB30|nr:hypothetical protein [Rhodococcus oryzae]
MPGFFGEGIRQRDDPKDDLEVLKLRLSGVLSWDNVITQLIGVSAEGGDIGRRTI